MTLTLIDIAKARRQFAVEKKRIKDEMRNLRHMRSANKPAPVMEMIQGRKPAA